MIIDVGSENYVMLARVIAFVRADYSDRARDLKNKAYQRDQLIDVTRGRAARTLVILDDGHVVVSPQSVDALRPETWKEADDADAEHGRVSNAEK